MASGSKDKFRYPPEWNDEDRMYFLFAPFPPVSDPMPTDSKLMFWRTLIASSSRELCECVFTERQLCERFQWREMQPKCLNNVIKIMEKTGEVRKLSKYQDSDTGWVGWGVSVVSSPLKWAWRNYVSSGEDDSEEEYVMVSYTKELADAVFTAHLKTMIHTTTDCLYTYSDFKEMCDVAIGQSSPQVRKAVELELVKEGLIVMGGASKENQDIVVKLAAGRNKTAPSLCETDFGIISMKSILAKLQAQVIEKTKCQERLKSKCIELMRSKQKTRALQYLRMSKSIESQIVGLEKHLENLQSVLDQIQIAETNAEVLRAYEAGSATLRNFREEHDLTLERVEDVMDEVQQVLEDADEVNNALSQNLHGDDDIDESELLSELGLLMNQDVSVMDSKTEMDDLSKDLEALSLNNDTSQDVMKFENKKENEEKEKATKKTRPVVMLS